MNNGRNQRPADWLSLGAETVPLQDGATQEAERERIERLRLISDSVWLRAIHFMDGMALRRRKKIWQPDQS
jgi:hypothetical protein